MVYCASVVEKRSPPFEWVWEDVKDDDKWEYRMDDAYDDICDDRNIDPDDEDNAENVKARRDAEESVKRDAERQYDQIVGFISGAFSGRETIEVFRSISVDDVDGFIDGLKERGQSFYRGKWQGLGIHWAWDIGHAIGYWAESDHEVIVVADAGCDAVDFEGTIESFLIYSDGLDSYDDENEILLLEGEKVSLKRIVRSKDPEPARILGRTVSVAVERDARV